MEEWNVGRLEEWKQRHDRACNEIAIANRQWPRHFDPLRLQFIIEDREAVDGRCFGAQHEPAERDGQSAGSLD